MKKLSFFVLILIAFETKADHILGADITYKCIDTSIGKYRFRVSLYRDCSGAMFGAEFLEIRKTGFSGKTPLNFIYKEEVTPLCQVPDVPTNPVTNCPGPAPNIFFKGVERWVYEVDYVIGRQIGFAYVAWTACCRSQSINTFAAGNSSAIWVQSVINTKFTNNSPVFTGSAYPSWCRMTPASFAINAIDSFDDKFEVINNQNIIKDSIVYELIAPRTGETDVNGNTPTLGFNPSLNPTNFLYTVNSVQFDTKTGLIYCTPSIVQDAILAVAVKEYRAIPNTNGVGYTRVLVGYVIKDIQFTVRDICRVTSQFGLNADSSKGIIPNGFNSYVTCKQTNIKLQIKLVNSSLKTVNFKDISMIDTAIIDNYRTSITKKINGADIETYLNITFDFKSPNLSTKFQFKATHCNVLGLKIEEIIPIEIKNIPNFSIAFSQDTITRCISTNQVKLELPGAESVKWETINSIQNYQMSDSNWIEFSPNHSQWVYANNLHRQNVCHVNDSIYIQIDTCAKMIAKFFVDQNDNCLYDSISDDLIPYYKFELFNVDLNTKKKYFTDTKGTSEFVFKRLNLNQLRFQNKLNCQIVDSIYSIYPILNDTILYQTIAINKSFLNYSLSIIPTGSVNIMGELNLTINSFTIIPNSTKHRNYTITLPLKCYFKSISPNSFTTNGNKINFSNYGEKTDLKLEFDSLKVGDILCFHIKLDQVGDEKDTTDNYATICIPAFTSYDPNHKSVAIASQMTSTKFSDKSNPFLYTIQFQNKGNFMARDISIIDTLDAKFNLETLSIIHASHPVHTSIDSNRVLKFDFKNINLPDSFSDEPHSHGYVQFQIKPNTNLTLGQSISNQAAIFFDFNPPIFTNKTYSQLDKIVTIPEMSISSGQKLQDWVYPSFVRCNETIQINSSNLKYILRLYSLEGKQIQSWSNSKSIQISTQISSGIYLLKLISEKEVLTQKIVVE